MCVCVCVCVRTYVCMYVYVRMCVCMCTYVCVYSYSRMSGCVRLDVLRAHAPLARSSVARAENTLSSMLYTSARYPKIQQQKKISKQITIKIKILELRCYSYYTSAKN